MSFLRIIGPASIEVWISSPVRSRKPVLMNTTRSRAARMQAARLTVVRRSSSMMPIFSVWRGRDRACPRPRPNSVVREGDLVGAVHLGLDDVDRAGAAVADRSAPCRSCIAIERASRRRRGWPPGSRARRRQHRVGEHVVADIAHQHQAAALQRAARRRPARCRRRSGLSRRSTRAAALLEASPTGRRSSGRASCGRRRPCRRHRPPRPVLEVHDGGDGGFQHDVGQAGRVVRADRVDAVDDDLDMQAVMAQQHGRGRAASPR